MLRDVVRPTAVERRGRRLASLDGQVSTGKSDAAIRKAARPAVQREPMMKAQPVRLTSLAHGVRSTAALILARDAAERVLR